MGVLGMPLPCVVRVLWCARVPWNFLRVWEPLRARDYTARGGGEGDALEGRGAQRPPQQPLGRRLEGVAGAVGGGYLGPPLAGGLPSHVAASSGERQV